MTTGSAYWIAAVRARETDRPDRLFADPHARVLAQDQGFATMARSEAASGGENTFIPVRVKWFDDLVTSAAAAGVRQVVLLGAGLDTRAFRLPLPIELAWFEVDRAFPDKEAILAGVPARCARHVVVADLGADWAPSLVDSGFVAGADTLWIAEGLFFYLSPTMISSLLREALRLGGPGSTFAADVIGAAGLDGPPMAAYRDYCARMGLPPPFGSDDPVALFTADGWYAAHVTAPGAADANYGRLPLAPGGVIAGRTHLVVASAASVGA